MRISSFQPRRSLTVTGNVRHRLLHRFDDAADAGGLAAERGADALVREVIDRAAAVQVDEIGAARFDERRGPAELLGIGAGQLHAEERLALELANQRELALAALLEPPRHRHLADRDARAELDAQAAVGKVRALRHRRHHHGAGQHFAKIHRLHASLERMRLAPFVVFLALLTRRHLRSEPRKTLPLEGRRTARARRRTCSDRCTS